MERVKIESSNIESVGYDDESKVLELEFKNGNVYTYFDVPRTIYLDFLTSESAGRFAHKYIYGSFVHSKHE